MRWWVSTIASYRLTWSAGQRPLGSSAEPRELLQRPSHDASTVNIVLIIIIIIIISLLN